MQVFAVLACAVSMLQLPPTLLPRFLRLCVPGKLVMSHRTTESGVPKESTCRIGSQFLGETGSQGYRRRDSEAVGHQTALLLRDDCWRE